MLQHKENDRPMISTDSTVVGTIFAMLVLFLYSKLDDKFIALFHMAKEDSFFYRIGDWIGNHPMGYILIGFVIAVGLGILMSSMLSKIFATMRKNRKGKKDEKNS